MSSHLCTKEGQLEPSMGESFRSLFLSGTKKKSLAMDKLPLDKEPNQSHRDKRPEECVGI